MFWIRCYFSRERWGCKSDGSNKTNMRWLNSPHVDCTLQVWIFSRNLSNSLPLKSCITFSLTLSTLNMDLHLFFCTLSLFQPVILFSLHIVHSLSLLPFLVSEIRELRVPSKCQGSRVKHMQHVLQFITPHLPWDFALLTSLSKSCLLFWNEDRAATAAGLPATRALSTSNRIGCSPRGCHNPRRQWAQCYCNSKPGSTARQVFIENICKSPDGTPDSRREPVTVKYGWRVPARSRMDLISERHLISSFHLNMVDDSI